MDVISNATVISESELRMQEWCFAGLDLKTRHRCPDSERCRVATYWTTASGNQLALELSYDCCRDAAGRSCITAAHAEAPEMTGDGRFVDDYGFQLSEYKRRRLAWDLLMRLEMRSVEQALAAQIAC